jgi:peptidoglycan hydrolase-like protein with peptidoglycan-binding domain
MNKTHIIGAVVLGLALQGFFAAAASAQVYADPYQVSYPQYTSPVYPYPQPSCPSLYRNLSLGTRGADVSALQQFLAGRGYYQPVTGYFGVLTRANVARFQQEQAVYPITGGMGPLTRAAIARACAGGYPYPTPMPTAISVTLPAQGATYSSGQVATIAWSGATYMQPVGYMYPQYEQVELALYSVNGTKVGIIAYGSGNSGSYNWSIPTGGTVCTQQYPNGLCGQYLQGQYFITATLMRGGTAVASANSGTFTINQPSAATTLTAFPTTGYRPLTVSFTVKALAGNYRVEFGDGQTQQVAIPAIMCITTPCEPPVQTITHTYINAGVYSATLRSDATGVGLGGAAVTIY